MFPFNKIHDVFAELNSKNDRIFEKLLELENKISSMEHQISSLQEQNHRLETDLASATEIERKLEQTCINTNEKLWRNDWEPNQNIRRRLFEYAGIDATRYVTEHMSKVRAFNQTLDILPYALSKVSIKNGLYLEFGVYSGRTINVISREIPDKIVYGFDCFEGLPETWRTGFEKGCFKTDSLPQVEPNVQLIKGYFDDTLPPFVIQNSAPCAFIHIDCDLYSSTKTIFKYLKNQIVSGTVISFDEYFNYPGWREGEYKAFQEFITENHLNYEYLAYVEVLEQVAVRIL